MVFDYLNEMKLNDNGLSFMNLRKETVAFETNIRHP